MFKAAVALSQIHVSIYFKLVFTVGQHYGHMVTEVKNESDRTF